MRQLANELNQNQNHKLKMSTGGRMEVGGQFQADKMRRRRQLAQVPPINFAIANPNQLPQLDAVIIRNLTYEIGRGSKRKTILNGINLTVPEGSIYGLLGPSGCGKTTMLRCIVGRVSPRAGSVMVFGLRPDEGAGEVPGRDVGYMPQEISIYEDFTIEETLNYFGKINRMSPGDIKQRIEFLLSFLDLPSKRRTVANLSGGQKRRVSLAAALVHSPPLLILDEPTVGVDPLLRQSIWQHLVAMTKSERISVIITTHYIEEARLANVVGLMRNGRILAEDSPDELMHANGLANLEDVFLKLCVTDSSRRAAHLATGGRRHRHEHNHRQISPDDGGLTSNDLKTSGRRRQTPSRAPTETAGAKKSSKQRRRHTSKELTGPDRERADDQTTSVLSIRSPVKELAGSDINKATVLIHTGTNKIELLNGASAYVNEAIEVFSSEDDDDDDDDDEFVERAKSSDPQHQAIRFHLGLPQAPATSRAGQLAGPVGGVQSSDDETKSARYDSVESYLDLQHMHWAARRANVMNLLRIHSSSGSSPALRNSHSSRPRFESGLRRQNDTSLLQWWKTLMAVTWKNYIRLRRNPPVLVFQFMLPAIQVILFCLCIGGEPFDVPVAVVNDETVPKSSLQFLQGLNKKIIRQVRYNNLTSAIEAVRRGQVWGAIHIPDKYSENLQSRLIMGDEVTNETISNGTIRVYPDLTNLHLAMTLESTFRDTFVTFARNSLEELGYDRSLADMPIQMAKPIYGTLRKDGYLEFMAPGVVISISYVMATGLTALAFILERRDGLLERSLVSGVQTSQILLAHAINQVFVMVFQIMLVLACTFFIFEIPSRGPFIWVMLLILLQGCTGMGFGLLVSAICAEENTAVMMVVGTFYTNLILAGIIWPIEAMPHWLRPISLAQPQTLPTDSLRHILSRGWTISEPAVLLGFGVTIGWLVVFLVAAGLIFKYSRG